jgi:glutathione peroxidase
MLKSIIILAAIVSGWTETSIYTLQVNKLGGGTINLSDYQNKKILLVNIASSSEYASQLTELETFYQQHKDSIVVIGFPSNSFGHEPNNDTQLQSLLEDTYHVHFPIATISSVTGTNANAVYLWLQSKVANGILNGKIKDDFQKFLISKNGSITGLFAPIVNVTASEFLDAIHY